LTVDIGFVIEGKKPSDLPEEMMGAIRVHEIDPIKAPTI
jgi:Protein ENHANCED DISEASE RESISTANCE 2, C-terminal